MIPLRSPLRSCSKLRPAGIRFFSRDAHAALPPTPPARTHRPRKEPEKSYLTIINLSGEEDTVPDLLEKDFKVVFSTQKDFAAVTKRIVRCLPPLQIVRNRIRHRRPSEITE
ncbi:hypothetical protein CDAR_386981 [Caerostris darwini]|uniref:Uncharacterized protein n=1 Tax=Caerostris darwini TaxID=1538125 RepID=A0AAV4WNM7_9ARAC|nr:hypothetical protein CDAR_386981 [Caerostris darwini]